MSTATTVPETFELTGDDAKTMLRSTDTTTLLKDSVQRLRVADGFSHARSLAFMSTLVLVQGLIVLVGFATAVGNRDVSDAIVRGIEEVAPGPSGALLTDAVEQARDAGVAQRYVPLIVGLVGSIVSGTTLLGQLERGLNRIYGVERDRPSTEKYGRALVLTIAAGSAIGAAFVMLLLGQSIGESLRNDVVTAAWDLLHWPVALGLVAAAMALLFRWSPRRKQPGWSWLAYGSTLAVVLWFAATLALGGLFRVSSTFGDTYGPLAGIIALQFWALASSIAVLLGGAVAAQLEAIRSGCREPVDERRAQETEPARAGGYSDPELARPQDQQFGHQAFR